MPSRGNVRRTALIRRLREENDVLRERVKQLELRLAVNDYLEPLVKRVEALEKKTKESSSTDSPTVVLPELLFDFKTEDWWNHYLRRRKTETSRKSGRSELTGWEDPLKYVDWIQKGKSVKLRLNRCIYVLAAKSYTTELINEDMSEVGRIKDDLTKTVESCEGSVNMNPEQDKKLIEELSDKLKNCNNYFEKPLDVFSWLLPPRRGDVLLLRGYNTPSESEVDDADEKKFNYYIKSTNSLVFNTFKGSDFKPQEKFDKTFMLGFCKESSVNKAFETLDKLVENLSQPGDYLFDMSDRLRQTAITVAFSKFRTEGDRYKNAIFRKAWTINYLDSPTSHKVKLRQWLSHSTDTSEQIYGRSNI